MLIVAERTKRGIVNEYPSYIDSRKEIPTRKSEKTKTGMEAAVARKVAASIDKHPDFITLNVQGPDGDFVSVGFVLVVVSSPRHSLCVFLRCR